MGWADRLPGPRSPRVKDDGAAIFSALRRLTGEWRYDQERLAVIATAWSLAGFGAGSIVFDVAASQERADGGGFHPRITEAQAIDLLERSFRKRNRVKLRRQAEGLLWGLEITAASFDFERLHRVQEDSCVIECRKLGIEERIERLRLENRRPQCVPIGEEA